MIASRDPYHKQRAGVLIQGADVEALDLNLLQECVERVISCVFVSQLELENWQRKIAQAQDGAGVGAYKQILPIRSLVGSCKYHGGNTIVNRDDR